MVSALERPIKSAKAPQIAEPRAKDPNALSVCMATARALTHDGTLVCVAVLKVDMAAIHAAPATAKAG